MSDYTDSFNMIFGCSNTTIDLFDNPYVAVKVFNIDQSYAPTPAEDVKLKQCTYEDMIEFIAPNVTLFYPNSLCFEDRSKL